MRNKASLITLLAGILLILMSGAVNASPVTFKFEGTIGSVYSNEFSGVNPGETFTGSFTFDSEREDSDARQNAGKYTYSSLSPNGMTMTVQFAGFTLETDPFNPSSIILVYDNAGLPEFPAGPTDFYEVDSKVTLPSGNGGIVFFMFYTRNNLGFLTSDKLTTMPPNINLADDLLWTFQINEEIPGGSKSALGGHMTLLVAPEEPPEPPPIVFDTGFQPSTNGFQFANWGLIGDWYGHCVGMTFAAFNYFRLEIDPMSCPEWINRLYIEWLQAKYLLDTVVQNAADALLHGQIPMTSIDVQTQYAVIRWALEHGLPCPILIAKQTPESHAVLAYSIKETSYPDRTDHLVYIYDSVHPGDSRPKLAIEERNGTWEFLSYAGYERFVVINPLQILASVYEMPLLFTLYSPVSLRITDPDGLTLDQHHSEFDGGYYRILNIDDAGDEEELAIILWPKEGLYSVRVIPNPDALPTDTYSLEVTADVKTFNLAENVPISDIPDEPYIIRSTEDEIMPIIPATIDFDPDTLNLKSDGKWITVYIELPVGHGYHASDINISRTFLEGLLEVQHSDVQDGVLMVKFDRQDLIIFLESVVGVIPPDDVPLTVIGELKDGRRFEGSDTVRVIKKGKNKK